MVIPVESSFQRHCQVDKYSVLDKTHPVRRLRHRGSSLYQFVICPVNGVPADDSTHTFPEIDDSGEMPSKMNCVLYPPPLTAIGKDTIGFVSVSSFAGCVVVNMKSFRSLTLSRRAVITNGEFDF